MISETTQAASCGEVSRGRIAFIDGFRGIAILLVLGYHYFHRWAARGFYPYGDMLAGFPPFEYGYHGVDLFFSVSGFVIAMTLESTRGILEFAVRRLARLWPAMILCSTLTYAFLIWHPIYFPQSPRNFLSSWTFLSGPVVWQRIFPGFNSSWIDGAYWSLFVEVRFYLLASLCYFSNRRGFWLLFPVLAMLSVVAYWLAWSFDSQELAKLIGEVTVAPSLPWFVLGMSMYRRYKRELHAANVSLCLAFSSMILVAATDSRWSALVTFLIVAVLFLACLSIQRVNRMFSARWLVVLGVSSYSLYLLHQNIGVTLISLIASAFSLEPIPSIAVAVFVATCIALLAWLIYRYWEAPMNRKIVRWFQNSRETRRRILTNET